MGQAGLRTYICDYGGGRIRKVLYSKLRHDISENRKVYKTASRTDIHIHCEISVRDAIFIFGFRNDLRDVSYPRFHMYGSRGYVSEMFFSHCCIVIAGSVTGFRVWPLSCATPDDVLCTLR